MNHNEKIVAKRSARILSATRKRRGMTQQDVAKLLDTSQANISKLENGLLIPSVLEWYEFCSATGISPECIMTGYVDRKEPTVLRSDRKEAGLVLPKIYGENRASKIRAVMPFLSYFKATLGEDKLESFCKAEKVDSDLFVDLDNQINLNFSLELSRQLIRSGALKEQDFPKLTRSVLEPGTHGSLYSDYNIAARTTNLLNALIRNAGFYEANFRHTIEEVSDGHLVLSVQPEAHLTGTAYKGDPVLGDFVCRYKQHYFQSFTTYGGATGATVRETECLHKRSDKCVYHFKFAS